MLRELKRPYILIALIICAVGYAFLFTSIYAQSSVKYYHDELSNMRFHGDNVYQGQAVVKEWSVTLTSPTTTFSVAGMQDIALTDSAAQTGVRPIGGEDNQIINIRMVGTNTARFDAGTSVPLDANLTLTPKDTVSFKCVAGTHGTQWVRRWSSVNH